MNPDMKTGAFTALCDSGRLWAFSFVIVCCFASLGYSQNYYPDEVGNIWFLRRVDGESERVVTIQGPEIVDGEELRIIEENTDGNITRLFVRTEPDGIKLFRSEVSIALLGEVTFDYEPPQMFLPIPIDLGSQWTVRSETEHQLVGKVQTVNRGEVIAIENVTVPAGTFRNCLKIKQDIMLGLGGIVDLALSNFMWLAPNIGLVKAVDTNDVIFELVRYDIAADEPPASVQAKGKLVTAWVALKRK